MYHGADMQGIVTPAAHACFLTEVPMIRSATTFALMITWISYAFADEADSPKFGKAFYPDSIRFVSSTSEDREAVTMMFDNFVLATSNGKGELLESRTKSFSVANKIESKDAVSVALDVRGFVFTEDGGSVAILVQAGGETTLVDFSKAIEAATSKPRDPEDALYLAAKEISKAAGLTVNSRPNESEDYFVRVPVKLAKGEPLQATVLLLVDRLPEAASGAMVTVDTIDISVNSDPAPKKKNEDSDKEESTEKKDPPTKKERTKSENDEKSSSRKSTEKKSETKKPSGDE
jgi:acylphosphatase